MACLRRVALLGALKQGRLFSNRSGSKGDPAKWLDDAVTYADVQTTFVDPCTSLPFPEEVNFLSPMSFVKFTRSEMRVFFFRIPFGSMRSIYFLYRNNVGKDKLVEMSCILTNYSQIKGHKKFINLTYTSVWYCVIFFQHFWLWDCNRRAFLVLYTVQS